MIDVADLLFQVGLGVGVGAGVETALDGAGGAGEDDVHDGGLGVGGTELEGHAEVPSVAGDDVRHAEHEGGGEVVGVDDGCGAADGIVHAVDVCGVA